MTHTAKRPGGPRGLRSKARRAALQALYQWRITGYEMNSITATFLEQWEIPALDEDYFRELTREIPRAAAELDERLAPVIDRPLSRIDPVERAILWIGTYELVFRPDIPWRVIVNESVELAKSFGAEQSHRYVNGVLDKVSKAVRE